MNYMIINGMQLKNCFLNAVGKAVPDTLPDKY